MIFKEFLEIILTGSDFNWMRFQRPAVRRKIYRLCASHGFRNLEQWCEFLESDPKRLEEFSKLLSVPFSRFFRDNRIFRFLRLRLLPELIEKRKNGPLRIWSAGCACGQEIWSVAMCLPPKQEVELIATDFNPACLKHARKGSFSSGTLRECPPEAKKLHFEQIEGSWHLRQNTLPKVLFQQHDLLRDPYPEDIDLILCRNSAFTYFTKAAQGRVAAGFDCSLVDTGALLLGKGERLPGHWVNSFEEEPPGSGCYRQS